MTTRAGQARDRDLDATRSAIARRVGGRRGAGPPVGRHPRAQRRRAHRRHDPGDLRSPHRLRRSGTRFWSSTTTASDRTEQILKDLRPTVPTLRYINNTPPNGFGFAVRAGLTAFKGDVVAIVMADASDRPEDLVAYYRKIEEGYDCAFGSRFMRGATDRRLPLAEADDEPAGQLLHPDALLDVVQRRHQRVQDVPADRHRRRAAAARLSLQPDRRAAPQGHRARLPVRRRSQPPG